MAKKITVEVNGVTLRGEATDLDGMFVSGLLLPDLEKILREEKGLITAFQEATSLEASAFKAETEAERKKLAEKIYEVQGERLLIRLNYNLEIRASFAQRMNEIFENMPQNFIKYERWVDQEKNVHDNSTIRLDTDPLMTIVTNLMQVMIEQIQEKAAKDDEEAKSKSKKNSKTKGFVAEQKALASASKSDDVEVEATEVESDEQSDDKDSRIAALEAELASLKGAVA